MESQYVFFHFHDDEKKLFERISDMGVDPQLLKKIISFWLWLESRGPKEVLKKIGFHDDKTVALICLEAETTLNTLQNPNSPYFHLPVTSALVSSSDSSVNLQEILEDKNKAWDRISTLFNGLCKNNISFRVSRENPSFTLEQIVRNLFQSVFNSNINDSESSSSEQSRCNPPANQTWSHVPPDQRSLYITFSHGFPIPPAQIYVFFTGYYGDCLEKVYVHNPRDAVGPPQFGRIVFKEWYWWLPEMILMGQQQVRFCNVFGKSMWCKRFMRKN